MNQNPVRGVFRLQASFHGKIRLLSKKILCHQKLVRGLIHMGDGKPVKITPEMQEKYVLSPKAEMDYANRKIIFEGEGRPETKMTVMQHHLDTNLHVNNGQYVRIAMDYLPEGYPIGQLRAEYKKQAVLGTEMYPVIFKTKDKTGVSLQDEAGTAYCNVEFIRM